MDLETKIFGTMNDFSSHASGIYPVIFFTQRKKPKVGRPKKKIQGLTSQNKFSVFQKAPRKKIPTPTNH